MNTRVFRTCKAFIGGNTDKLAASSLAVSEISETSQEENVKEYNGRSYQIFPCVALVEGVLHGANSANPELALISEVGTYGGAGWNGRPLVMNHPKVNGEFVSANSPEVLADWCIGYIFNTWVEDSKLKTEAWLDTELMISKGGEYQDILDKLQAGEVVEVSTGLFADITSKQGVYGGKNYEGIWSNVVPDHLAVLSIGTLGACSIEDGCGIPRINQKEEKMTSININSGKSKGQTIVTPPCGCQAEPSVQNAADITKVLDPPNKAQKLRDSALGALLTNSVAGDVVLNDVYELLHKAGKEQLQEALGEYYFYLAAATTEVAVYEVGYGNYYQVPYNMDSNGNVNFTGSPVEVNLMTRVVEVSNQSTEGNQMTNPNVNNAPSVDTVADTATTTAVETPAITVESYVAAAPEGIKQILSEGLARVQAHRNELIQKISTNAANKLAPTVLETMNTEVLEGIAALSQQAPVAATTAPVTNNANTETSATPNYAGIAGGPSPVTNSQELNYTPAPQVFERKN